MKRARELLRIRVSHTPDASWSTAYIRREGEHDDRATCVVTFRHKIYTSELGRAYAWARIGIPLLDGSLGVALSPTASQDMLDRVLGPLDFRRSEAASLTKAA